MNLLKAYFGKLTARRALAAFAAIALVYFAAGGTFLHEHKAGRGDTPCHVCQSLHLPTLAAGTGLTLDSPELSGSYVSKVAVASPKDSIAFSHTGRAPPTA